MGDLSLLATFCLLLASVWLGLSRFRMRLESSWPLVYYLTLVVYLNTHDLVLNPYVVYVAVVCALFVRFEFMNDRVILFVRIIEVAALAHIGFRLFNALVKAF